MAQTQLTDRQMRIRQRLIDLGVMGVIGVVLAFIGPFGTFAAPLAIRLAVWVSFAYIGYALYNPIDALAQQLAPRLDLPVWAVRVAGVLLASVPMSIVVWLLPRLPDNIRLPDASAALTTYVYVTLIGSVITLLFTLGQRSGGRSEAVAVHAETPKVPTHRSPFLERLPAHLGTQLLALEMEDHYVRAHTLLGSELVLMRLGDAIAELEGTDGLQVHRSWWVAHDAVEDVQRDGRTVRLVLPGGLHAPVARSRMAQLKDAGWL